MRFLKGCEEPGVANGGKSEQVGKGGDGNAADGDEGAAVKADPSHINGIADSAGSCCVFTQRIWNNNLKPIHTSEILNPI